MFQSVSLFIGLRYSRSTKGHAFISFISFFSIAGIALGVMALVTVVSVMNGFESNLKKSMLSMVPHIQIQQVEEGQQANPSETALTTKDVIALKDGQTADILNNKDIDKILPYQEAELIMQSAKGLSGVLAQGVFDDFNYGNLLPTLYQGSWQDLHEKKYAIAISRYQSLELGVTVGETVRLIAPQASRYTPLGRIPSQRWFTVVAIYSSGTDMDKTLVYFNGEKLNRLLKRPMETIDSIRVQLHDAFDAPSISANIQQQVFKQKYAVTDWRDQQGALFAAVAVEKKTMSLLLGLIILVAGFNIVSALIMMVGEKCNEVAILKTLGLKGRQVRHVFMIQGLYNGLLGTIIGGSAGLIVASSINEILAFLGVSLLGGQQLPIEFDWVQLSAIFLGAIAMSFLATLYPAKQASDLVPAQILRYE